MTSAIAMNARCAVVARLLDGGTLEIYGAEALCLARIPLASPSFTPPVDGTMKLVNVVGPGLADGMPRWWRMLSSTGALVLTGVAGPTDAELLVGPIQADGEVFVEDVVYQVEPGT